MSKTVVSSDIFSSQKGSKRIPFSIACNSLNENIIYYDYAHLDRFLNESSKSCSIERFQGLFGEIFENNVYENIMEWARKDNKVKWFALKGAYVKVHFKRNGLSFNSKRQLVYNIDGLDFAEFDALFVRDERIYFVEMTNSIKSNISRRYKKRIYQKTQLLNKIFSQYKAVCLVVLNNLIRDQKNWPKNCMFWYVDQLKIDYSILEKMKKQEHLKYIEFNKNIDQKDFPCFDYYTTLREATKLLRKDIFLKKEIFIKNIEKLFGLYNKFYYGITSQKELYTLDVKWPNIPKDCNLFYVALKVEPFTYPILTFYYFHKTLLYSIKLDIFKKEPVHEEVMRRKRTAIDLRKMKKELQKLFLNSKSLFWLNNEINGQFCMMV